MNAGTTMDGHKVAVVIGGTGGIGMELTRQLPAANINVVVAARRVRPFDWGTLGSSPDKRLQFSRVDVTNEEDVRSLIADAGSPVDYLIYAASREVDIDVRLAEYSTSKWRETIEVYLTGFFLCFKEFLKYSTTNGHVKYDQLCDHQIRVGQASADLRRTLRHLKGCVERVL